MASFTTITRLIDGLPLVATTEASAPGADTETHKAQAKAIVKKLNNRSPARMSIDSGPFAFSYIIEDGLVYLVMSDRAYPRKLAFAYLAEAAAAFAEELARDLGPSWRAQIDTVGRPYAFLRFDRTLQRIKRDYADPTTKQNTSRLAGELADIQGIMRKNIEEVLDRGERLENVSKISSRLVSESKRFKWGAKKLNVMAAWGAWAPYIVVLLVVAGVVYWRVFM